MNRQGLHRVVGHERPRDNGIDAFKYLMALFVIVLHLLPDTTLCPAGTLSWPMLVEQVCRCAVPFFFIASGYYLRVDRGFSANAKRALGNAPIYVFWAVTYTAIGSLHAAGWEYRSIWWLEGAYGFHLWFLPALIFAIILVSGCASIGGRRLAYAVAACLALP
jgi:surface polysaccharide O-acyltransferase-like enzyme